MIRAENETGLGDGVSTEQLLDEGEGGVVG